MSGFHSYNGASYKNGPSPVVFNKIPKELRSLEMPGVGAGFYDSFVLGASHATTGVDLPGWIVSEVTDGQIIPTNQEFGGVTFTDGAENSGIQAQTGEFVLPDTARQAVFGARIEVNIVDQNDIYLGLTTHDTDLAQSTPDNGIAFRLQDGSADIVYDVMKDNAGAEATDTGSDIVADTAVRLEAYVDGEEAVYFYVDGVLKATYSTLANIPDDEELAMSIALICGSTAATTMKVSWAYAYTWHKHR